jgi:hypothetical protein
MIKSSTKKSLLDAYQFEGFKTLKAAKGMVGDKNARVLLLSRRFKKKSLRSMQQISSRLS